MGITLPTIEQVTVAPELQKVPVVDLSASDDEAAAVLAYGCQVFGFFYIKNHGVPEEQVQGQFDWSKKFFDLPLDVKTALPFDVYLDIGYQAPKSQTLNPDRVTQATADTKEGLLISNNADLKDVAFSEADPLANSKLLWPHQEALPGYEAAMREYFMAMWHLNRRLNHLMAVALKMSDEEVLGGTTQPFCVLKQMRYAGQVSSPEAGLFGAGAHCDWGSWTILATAGPGLQVYFDEAEKWLDVPPQPGCLVINSGDLIRFYTNGLWKSAMHRVVTTSTAPRFSTAYFTYPDMDAVIKPLDRFVSAERPSSFPPTRVSDYFHFKIEESCDKMNNQGVAAAAGAEAGKQ